MGKTVYNFSNRLQRVKGRGAARARLITGKRCFVDDNPACEGNREAEGERKGQRSIPSQGKIPSPVFFFFLRGRVHLSLYLHSTRPRAAYRFLI